MRYRYVHPDDWYPPISEIADGAMHHWKDEFPDYQAACQAGINVSFHLVGWRLLNVRKVETSESCEQQAA